MPFKKGDPNINTGGRPKGTGNKVNDEIRAAFSLVLQNKLDDLESWLDHTARKDPAKAAELLIKLSERFVPALARTELTGADGEDLFKHIKFEFGQAPEEQTRE
jgi:plasmid stabilization system protein ParE